MENLTDRVFVEALKTAVRATVRAVCQKHPDAQLAGYALCTDDELSTLSYLAVTDEYLRVESDPDLQFTPTDWPYDPEQERFDDLSNVLQSRSEAAEEDASYSYETKAFDELVRALAETRAENIFGPDVFLAVLSTDPCDHTEALADAAVATLNEPHIVEQWSAFCVKWD